MLLVLDAVIDSYIAIIMLHVGGATRKLSFSLVPAPPAPPPKPTSRPAQTKSPDTTRSGLSVTTNGGMTSTDDVTLSSILQQSTTGHGSAPNRLGPPPWMIEPQTTYVVGPMMYTYFTTANISDAGFTVDLFFQHSSYLNASFRFIIFDSALYR